VGWRFSRLYWRNLRIFQQKIGARGERLAILEVKAVIRRSTYRLLPPRRLEISSRCHSDLG
jgi:hypothetical protein